MAAVPVHVPRINNNDDEVKLVEWRVAVGDRVEAGQVIAAVETDKAVVDVECPTAGDVLATEGEIDTQLRVGSVMAWIGTAPGDKVPASQAPAVGAQSGASGNTAPTAKALALLREFGLAPGAVASSGERLSADDVRRHITAKGLRPAGAAAATTPRAATASLPEIPGTLQALKSTERGMLHTVSWQRDVAVPGYIETTYDHAAWERSATEVGKAHGLLLSPLLPMMAWRLVELAEQLPRCNATIADDQRHEYGTVNLGFTVQAGEVLYLAVVRDAQGLGEIGFVQRLVELQRRAAAHELTPAELGGATIGFSSMARWKIARHVPILAPHTALMVAHTVDANGQGVLGATYDHRVLHGGDVATLLRKLGQAPKPQS